MRFKYSARSGSLMNLFGNGFCITEYQQGYTYQYYILCYVHMYDITRATDYIFGTFVVIQCL